MYADLGPHVQAPVRPPSTGDIVQYSSLLHGEAEQAPLDPAGTTSSHVSKKVGHVTTLSGLITSGVLKLLVSLTLSKAECNFAFSFGK